MLNRLGESAPEETSPLIPRIVASRTLLWNDGVIELAIPKECRYGFFGEGESKVDFIQFSKRVKSQGFKSGRVNVFVRASDPEQYAGTTIKAAVEIWMKEFENDGKYLHVDLIPTDAKPTHWLKIEKDSRTIYPPSTVSFRTPAPLDGKVVMEKIPETKAAVKKPEEPEVKSTGDPQLDRLLGQGWLILREDERCVYLYKGEGDKRKTTTHFKPKKKK